MTEQNPARASFAPVWSRAGKAPTSGAVIPPYGRARVFNRDLTAEELEPLTKRFPVPSRTLRRIGGYALFGVGCFNLVFWAITLLMAFLFARFEVSDADEQKITSSVHATLEVVASLPGWIILAAIAVGGAGIVTNCIAWKKWGDSLAAAWWRRPPE